MPYQKGHPKMGGREKGTPNKTTLLKEERRAMFEAAVSEQWHNVIEGLLNSEPKYVADQFMGKAPDKTEISGSLDITDTSKLKAIAEKVEEELDGTAGTTGTD